MKFPGNQNKMWLTWLFAVVLLLGTGTGEAGSSAINQFRNSRQTEVSLRPSDSKRIHETPLFHSKPVVTYSGDLTFNTLITAHSRAVVLKIKICDYHTVSNTQKLGRFHISVPVAKEDPFALKG